MLRGSREYLAKDLALPQERIHAQVDVLAEHAISFANQVKRLIFVENIVDSAKVCWESDEFVAKLAVFSSKFCIFRLQNSLCVLC